MTIGADFNIFTYPDKFSKTKIAEKIYILLLFQINYIS